MNNQTTTYYIPTNPSIKSGPIYTLYINNNKNLDLTSILVTKPTPLLKVSTISINTKDYNQLLKINKNYQNIIKSLTNKIELFITEQKKYITELTKLEKEYNTISKLISIKGDNNE